MATNKTSFLNMNDWVGTDPFRREEINANFRALDAKAKEHEDELVQKADKSEVATLTTQLAQSATMTGITAASFPRISPETDDTGRINRAIDSVTAPAYVVIPAGFKYVQNNLTLKDNVILIDRGDGRFHKMFFRGIGQGQSIYENEFQILANYNPGLALDNIGTDAGKRSSIVFRRNGLGTWQLADDPLNDGKVMFFIQQLTNQAGTTVDKTRFSIDETGKVGIGTRAQTASLHISTTDGAQAVIENTAGTTTVTLKANSDNTKRKHITLDTAGVLKINKADNSATIFSLDDSGNVTIAGNQTVTGNTTSTGTTTLNGAVTFNAQMMGYKSNNFSTVTTGATPSVSGKGGLIINYASPETVTNFTSAAAYQEITLVFINANATVQNGANIKLNGAVNWTPTAYSTLTLIKVDSQTGAWVEKCRSQN